MLNSWTLPRSSERKFATMAFPMSASTSSTLGCAGLGDDMFVGLECVPSGMFAFARPNPLASTVAARIPEEIALPKSICVWIASAKMIIA